MNPQASKIVAGPPLPTSSSMSPLSSASREEDGSPFADPGARAAPWPVPTYKEVLASSPALDVAHAHAMDPFGDTPPLAQSSTQCVFAAQSAHSPARVPAPAPTQGPGPGPGIHVLGPGGGGSGGSHPQAQPQLAPSSGMQMLPGIGLVPPIPVVSFPGAPVWDGAAARGGGAEGMVPPNGEPHFQIVRTGSDHEFDRWGEVGDAMHVGSRSHSNPSSSPSSPRESRGTKPTRPPITAQTRKTKLVHRKSPSMESLYQNFSGQQQGGPQHRASYDEALDRSPHHRSPPMNSLPHEMDGAQPHHVPIARPQHRSSPHFPQPEGVQFHSHAHAPTASSSSSPPTQAQGAPRSQGTSPSSQGMSPAVSQPAKPVRTAKSWQQLYQDLH
eukprot:CAMPEP_0114233194 /NCGR_PEP_ID=MMETSP0058-20121206/5025_1 /TAXON_ID=36894 /ORGANISM="Pyramimonas parkeae, CCMP726" /LENGTH=384 /DNA_ID=CAMNT_0001344749 /DNA_START=502 /DNA_END=1656 /DNA_ORIENTATION=-